MPIILKFVAYLHAYRHTTRKYKNLHIFGVSVLVLNKFIESIPKLKNLVWSQEF